MKLYQRFPSVLASLLMSVVMSGCTTSSYMGIGFGPGVADPALQQLAQRARRGDKQAQLELGIKFEEGRGVARNLVTARKLYRLAAADSRRQVWVYVPSVGGNRSGMVNPYNGSPTQPGLTEARRRLAGSDN